MRLVLLTCFLLAGCAAPIPDVQAPVVETESSQSQYAESGVIPLSLGAAGVRFSYSGETPEPFMVPPNQTVTAVDIQATASGFDAGMEYRLDVFCKSLDSQRGCQGGGLLGSVEGSFPLSLKLVELNVTSGQRIQFELSARDVLAAATLYPGYTLEGTLWMTR